MTEETDRTHRSGELPDHHAVLHGTDWASVATASGTGEHLPTALVRLVDPDPLVRQAALADALRPVSHQNSIYPATTPIALYVAAILGHPALAPDAPRSDRGRTTGRPTLLSLLDWLGDTAYDADDQCLALCELDDSEELIGRCEDMHAFRDVRPALFHAVRAFLDHDDVDVRHTALTAALPLAEHPALTVHRGELAGHARRLLATEADRLRRDRVLDALRSWGCDTGGLENAADVEARRRYAARAAARAATAGDWPGGGYSQSPPF
ncbi:hypothetical protein ACFYUL_14180 [Streptomyces sp. NPDC004311]|uniref:hypothetical protein n=1 Tax=Streptomyces sp. NPDC004311 TaxID=3364698 RepID=UPI0036B35158